MSAAPPHGHSDPAHHAGAPFWRHLVRAAPVLLLVTAITTVLAENGLLRGFESAVLDVWLQTKSPRQVDDVVLVAIDDADYRELFARRSPLAAARVQEIVAAVVAGAPRVVGVDLDTSEEAYAGYAPPPGVLWGRDGILDESDAARATSGGAHGEPATFRPGPVLGREGAAAASIGSGLALMPQDADGLIRRYRHDLPILDEGGRREEMPTLGWAVVRASDHATGHPEREASHHALVLNFAGDRYAFPRLAARDVLAGAKTPAWAAAGPLKDKVVLIGGTYRAARDEYITPIGALAGVQLVGQAVESELHGGGIRPLAHRLMAALEVLSGVLLVWINFRFRLGVALALSLVAMPLCTLLASLLAFSSLAYWFNFVPTLVGVWIHELIDHAREYRAMHEALYGAHRAAAPSAH